MGLIALVPHDGREPPARSAISSRARSGAPSRRSGIRHFSAGRRSCRESSRSNHPTPPGPREVRVIPGGAGTGSLPATGPRPRMPGCLDRVGHRPRRPDPPHPGHDWEPRKSPDLDRRPKGWPTPRAISWRWGPSDWMLRDLTAAMGHSESVDRESLTARAAGRCTRLANRRLAERRSIACAPRSRS